MLRARIYFSSPIAFFLAMLSYSQAFGKGIDNLNSPVGAASPPPSLNSNSKMKNDKKVSKNKKKVDEERIKQIDLKNKTKSSDDLATKSSKTDIPSKFFVGTSFGLVQNTQDSNDWEASGASDISFFYRLPEFKQLRKLPLSILVSLRYYPFDVAPHISGDLPEAYSGIVQSYLFGAEANFKLRKKIFLIGGAELGFVSTNLKSLLSSSSDNPPSDSGFLFVLAGGVKYQLLEALFGGIRFGLGFGSMTNIQFSGNLTFAL